LKRDKVLTYLGLHCVLQIHVFARTERDAIKERGGLKDSTMYVLEWTRSLTRHLELCFGVCIKA
jgi:hypothetical protein